MIIESLILVHLFCTIAMVGVIWFVQIVHYPLFRLVGVDGFSAYESVHQSRTTYVVAPLMLIEAATAIGLFFTTIAAESLFLYCIWAGVVLLAINWISTFFVQVPAHSKLSEAFDASTHTWLVRSNWIRTVAWTARGVVACVLASLI